MAQAPEIQGGLNSTEQERSELAAVLGSDIFTRAPNLSRVLAYVCEKYFRGETHEIKEYNIAVEALGRPASFDPQADAIVRVDMYHLRKRLQQYYSSEGAGHELQIQLPQGQYVPVFVRVAPGSMQAPPELPGEVPEGPLPNLEQPKAQPQTQGRSWIWWVVGAILVAVAAVALFRAAIPRQETSGAAASKPAQAPVFSPDGAVRILAGSNQAQYVDTLGRVWYGDRFFTGGRAEARAIPQIQRSQEPGVFQAWRAGSFDYGIPLPKGNYQLNLYFAERVFGESNPKGGGETNRLMNVFVNRELALKALDVIADAGGSNTATIKVIKNAKPDWDGVLRLQFNAFTDEAFVNGIEVLPAPPAGGMRPIRIATLDKQYKDSQGRVWETDRFYSGGRRNQAVLARIPGHPDSELYSMQRFGHFTYVVPVPHPGKYRITLHFVENWLGPTNPGGGGAGHRVFDVLCNGTAVLRNFDIFAAAGGENRPIQRVIRNVTSSPQGKITLSFMPSANYAALTALEIEEETE